MSFFKRVTSLLAPEANGQAAKANPVQPSPLLSAQKGLEYSVRIDDIEQITPTIKRFTFVANERDLPGFAAGSHIMVPVKLADGRDSQHAYSLVNPTERMKNKSAVRYQIAVKLDENGAGGSKSLHELVERGQSIFISKPRNAFPLLRSASHCILIAGGIGVTPILAMARELLAREASFEIHYAARSEDEAAFAEDLRQLAPGKFKLYLGATPDESGFDLTELLKEPVEGTHIFACGPAGMLAAAEAAAQDAGWPAANFHLERFAASSSPDDKPFTVTLQRSGKVLEVPAETTLLDVLLENGISIESSCGAGVCGTCTVEYSAGVAEHRDEVLSEEERRTHLCTCVSRSQSDNLTLEI